jgi:hypothetical protein
VLAQLLHAALVLDVLDELRRVADNEAHSDPENAKNRRNDAQGDRDEDEDEDDPHGNESVIRVVQDESDKTSSERKLEHDVSLGSLAGQLFRPHVLSMAHVKCGCKS